MKTLLAVLVTFFVVPFGLGAYSCMGPATTVEGATKRSDYIFIGQVEKVEVIADSDPNQQTRLIVSVSVKERLKSEGADKRDTFTLHLVSGEQEAILEGGVYLFYVLVNTAKEWLGDGAGRRSELSGENYPGKDDLIFELGLCSRTRSIVNATGDLEFLRNLRDKETTK